MQTTRRRSPFSPAIRSTLLAGLLGLACAAHERPEADHGASWGYSGDQGPSHWAELSPEYVLAALGGSQSPIDIVMEDVITADLPPIEFETKPVPLKMLNNGHTLELIAPGGSTLRYGKHEFVLTQYHFHAPSEHRIDGRQAAAEVHLVHADGAGQLAVIGVLVEVGEEDNPFFLSFIETDAPESPGEEVSFPDVLVDTAHLFDTCDDYYMYDGSLTTPPATEGVRWFICAAPRVISSRQLEVLRQLYFRNNRPIQPARARTVLTPR